MQACSAAKGTEKDRIRSMGTVRGSFNKKIPIGSAEKNKKAFVTRDRGKVILIPASSGFKFPEGRLALSAATYFEMAVW